MEGDTLGVLETTRAAVESARYVAIEPEPLERVAHDLASRPLQVPEWRAWPHFWHEPELTANYVLVLDALNFCFWGEPRWQVEYQGRSFDGYWALAAALRRAIDAGEPVLDADYLAELTPERLDHLLRGRGRLQLLKARHRHLRELGRVLRDRFDGSFAGFVAERGEGRVVRLVQELVSHFPSFDDVATYQGNQVRFYKRAQLLVSDLYGALGGQGPGAFEDLDQLTAFADYKLPQFLRALGVLAYAPELASAVAQRRELAPGSPEEVEIRAATVWAVERLRQSLAARVVSLRAFELDWHLWSAAQDLSLPHPYHRTLTTAY